MNTYKILGIFMLMSSSAVAMKREGQSYALKGRNVQQSLVSFSKEDEPLIAELIKHGVEVAACDERGWTYLHWACGYGDYELILVLLQQGVSIAAATNKGATALHIAAEHGYVAIVELLLEEGASSKTVDMFGFTALHAAAFHGRVDVCRVLLKWGTFIEARADYDFTPLHLAAIGGYMGVCDELIVQGASVDCAIGADVVFKGKLIGGYTQLHFAIAYRREGVVVLLLKKGAAIYDRTQRGATVFDLAHEWNNQLLIAFLNYYLARYPREMKKRFNRLVQEEDLLAVVDHGNAGRVCILLQSTSYMPRELNEALTLAVNQDQQEIIDLLLQKSNNELPVRKKLRIKH